VKISNLLKTTGFEETLIASARQRGYSLLYFYLSCISDYCI